MVWWHYGRILESKTGTKDDLTLISKDFLQFFKIHDFPGFVKHLWIADCQSTKSKAPREARQIPMFFEIVVAEKHRNDELPESGRPES